LSHARDTFLWLWSRLLCPQRYEEVKASSLPGPDGAETYGPSIRAVPVREASLYGPLLLGLHLLLLLTTGCRRSARCAEKHPSRGQVDHVSLDVRVNNLIGVHQSIVLLGVGSSPSITCPIDKSGPRRTTRTKSHA